MNFRTEMDAVVLKMLYLRENNYTERMLWFMFLEVMIKSW